jgi:hypothetical protein
VLALAPSDEEDGRAADEEFTSAIRPNPIVPQADSSGAEVQSDGTVRTARILRAVNLRSRPVSGSKVIKVLPTGVDVALYGCKGWCEVSYQGSRGFIYQSFVQRSSAAVSKPRVAARKPVEKKPTPVNAVTRRVR